MNIAIVYDSSTGKTANAAREMGKLFEAQGHQCQVDKVTRVDPVEVAEADLICIGSWVRGWFIVKQHPTGSTMQFIERLDNISGKQVVVFCTYLLAVGSTLSQMAKPLEAKGANVVAQFKFRGPEPDEAFASFAKSLS